jgi:hypothetical protein
MRFQCPDLAKLSHYAGSSELPYLSTAAVSFRRVHGSLECHCEHGTLEALPTCRSNLGNVRGRTNYNGGTCCNVCLHCTRWKCIFLMSTLISNCVLCYFVDLILLDHSLQIKICCCEPECITHICTELETLFPCASLRQSTYYKCFRFTL